MKTRLALTDKHQHSLEQWRQAVATLSGLDFPHEQPSSSIGPIVRNQNAALSLTYYHVAILLYRPFLLDTFSDIHFERARMKDHVQHCLDACMSIVEIVERLYENDPVFRARWVSGIVSIMSIQKLDMSRLTSNSLLTTVGIAPSFVSMSMSLEHTNSLPRPGPITSRQLRSASYRLMSRPQWIRLLNAAVMF